MATPTPVARQTSAQTLQAATIAPPVDVGNGRTSFTFAPSLVSPSPAAPAGQPVSAPAEAPSASPSFGSALAPKPLGGGSATIARATSTPGGGSDDGYEAFLERLKRDLLREREQYGDLLGDLSW